MIWPTVALGEITTKIGSGSTPRGGEESYKPHGVPLIRSMNVHDGRFVDDGLAYLDERQAGALKHVTLQTDDVLLNITGASVARVCRLPDCLSGGRVNQHVSIVRPDKTKLDPNFLAHLLRTPEAKARLLRVAGAGATREAITKAQIEEFKIPLPPLDEQRRIAAILDKADALRRKRRRSLDLLDRLTQSIFLDMFGAFLNGKSDATLADFADIQVGFPFKSSEYTAERDGIRLCRGANVLPKRIDWSDLARWPKTRTNEFFEYSLQPADIVIAMDRPWISSGFKAARISSDDLPALLVQRVARIRPKSEADGSFLYAIVQSPFFSGHFRPTETTVPHISPVEIKKFSFTLPPTGVKERFAASFATIERLVIAATSDLAKIESIFFSLQHRAFSGHL